MASRALPALALVTSACLPPAGPPPGRSLAPPQVRARESGASVVATGRLVRLTSDSVYWSPGAPADAPMRGRRIADLDRLEIGESLDQRQAFARGGLRGALVGAALGGLLLLARSDAAGGAVGLVLAGYWLGGVVGGQSVESPDPPRRWRVVHERRE